MRTPATTAQCTEHIKRHSPNPIVDIMIIMCALEGRIVQQILKNCNEKKESKRRTRKEAVQSNQKLDYWKLYIVTECKVKESCQEENAQRGITRGLLCLLHTLHNCILHIMAHNCTTHNTMLHMNVDYGTLIKMCTILHYTSR